MVVEGRLLKASLGTTKYCSSFLKGQTCYKPECMYLHEVADEKISFTKEDMHQGKHTEYERRLLEHMFALFGIQGSTGFNQQQQQTSTCRELVVARNRARVMTSGGEQLEKKRPTSGSVENLPKMISQQIKQKKGNDDTVLTQKHQQQQQKPLTINGDVLNNNNFEKSNNSQQQMLLQNNNKMSSSSTSTTPSPPTFVAVSQNVLIQQHQQQPPPNSSAIINSFVDDDDLGFDPFEGFFFQYFEGRFWECCEIVRNWDRLPETLVFFENPIRNPTREFFF
ncbi:unnamed protein product [Meloidogyne enterolobii]|uniref:Uncharacterized protein n=1 Tax=Meloidogyne enterolobii TaxID=390850 RepID=A0ACB1A5R9_MELEN